MLKWAKNVHLRCEEIHFCVPAVCSPTNFPGTTLPFSLCYVMLPTCGHQILFQINCSVIFKVAFTFVVQGGCSSTRNHNCFSTSKKRGREWNWYPPALLAYAMPFLPISHCWELTCLVIPWYSHTWSYLGIPGWENVVFILGSQVPR